MAENEKMTSAIPEADENAASASYRFVAEQSKSERATFSFTSNAEGSYVRTTNPVLMPRDYGDEQLVYIRASELRKARGLLKSAPKGWFSFYGLICTVGTTMLGVVVSNIAWNGSIWEIVDSLINGASSFPGLVAVGCLVAAVFLKRDKVRVEADLAARVLECIKDPDDCIDGVNNER